MNEQRTAVREEVFYKKSKRGSGKGLTIFLVIMAIFFGLVLATVTFSKIATTSQEYIAVLSVEGSIEKEQAVNPLVGSSGYQHQWTLDQINLLMEDDMNTGIFLFLDTPGGSVYASDELYLKLKEYKEVTSRPVYVYMGEMAASGGYYIAAAGDWIAANRNCWTGSIGVKTGMLFDISELLKQYGVSAEIIASGENKGIGEMTKSMTDEQKEILQTLIDEAYMQFVSIVAEERNMSMEEATKLADGRPYSAKQAKELGLIDAILTLEEAEYDMQKRYRLWNSDFVDIEYDYQEDLSLPFFFPGASFSLPLEDIFKGIRFTTVQQRSNLSI